MKPSIIALVTALLWATVARADDVHVAAAANFAAPIKQIAAVFERESGHTVKLSLGGTGKLYAQIRNGAPFDLLLAADAATPAKLEADGVAVAGSRFTYAIGRLVLWSARPGVVDPRGEVLGQRSFRHLALANPKLAPYGQAAVAALTALKWLDTLRPSFVYGENIGQTYQFVASGNAELGLIALSQVMQDGQLVSGSAWIVPTELYPPIRQEAVLLERGRHKPAAAALLSYLKGEPARAILSAYGYTF